MKPYPDRIARQMVNLYGSLSEKDRRRYAAVEAVKLGYGGTAYIADLFGCHEDTIRQGRADVEALPADAAADRVRKRGGRKQASLVQPALVDALRQRIEVHTAGSAVEPGCLWTNRSTKELSVELLEDGFSVSPNTIDRLLRDELDLGRRQAVRTVPLGENIHRNDQFERIAELKAHFVAQGWPVVSIDTKKKVDLGDFFRPGRGWTNGHVRALDHDFPSAGLGKVIPYGVYDLLANEALVLLARGADTGELACDAIGRWWYRLGRRRYEHAPCLLVLADSGGSNGYRVTLFRERLCQVTRLLHMPIRVAHLPPYCSKHNPIDHRVFCHLTRSLRGVLCRSIEVVRDAFARTTTSTGLSVVVETASRLYCQGIKAATAFKANEPIIRDLYLPQFNYIAPIE